MAKKLVRLKSVHPYFVEYWELSFKQTSRYKETLTKSIGKIITIELRDYGYSLRIMQGLDLIYSFECRLENYKWQYDDYFEDICIDNILKETEF